MKNGRSRKYQAIHLLRALSKPKRKAFADSGNPGDLENKNTLGKVRMHEWTQNSGVLSKD